MQHVNDVFVKYIYEVWIKNNLIGLQTTALSDLDLRNGFGTYSSRKK